MKIPPPQMRSVFIPAERISAVNERWNLIFEVAKGEVALPQFQFDGCFDHLLFFLQHRHTALSFHGFYIFNLA